MTIVDVEESCARLGLDIAAIVENVEGADYALSPHRIVAAGSLSSVLTSMLFHVPIFTPGHRLAARRDAAARGFTRPLTIVDPTAIIAVSAKIGAGVYVNAGAVIGGAASIGDWVWINRTASIGHHAELAEFSSVGPGTVLCGAVRLGRGAVVAAGAIVLPDVTIGDNSVVAAGSVLRESIPDHCLAVGNPARVVKRGYAGFRNMSV
jgi:acetyltransferase-like isoleucine patch superfamily enzyme